MKLGVFLCTCNKSVDIDFRDVRKSIKKEIEVVELLDQLCQEGLDYIIDDVRRFELDGILIAACTEKNRIFDRVTAGLDGETFVLNLREHCGWVHGKKEATEKAKSMINAAIHSAGKFGFVSRPEKITVDAGYDVLVIGNEDDDALGVAKTLSNVADVHLLTNRVREWCDEPELHFGKLNDIKGDVGDFTVEITAPIAREQCISCGLCAEACPKNAIHYDAVFTIGEECNECGECIEVCPTGAIGFDNQEVLRVGQILVIDKTWQGPTRFGIYRADDGEDALRKACELVLNLGEIEKEKPLTLDLKRCASGRSELVGCEHCLPCPYEAIERKGVKMAFSDVRCQGCGLCTSLCPLSVPQLREYPPQLLYSQIENLLSGDSRPKILLFACQDQFEKLNEVGRKKMQYPAVLPLFVPCIDMISEAHILSAIERGADGVILWGCENSHHEQIASTVTFAQKTLSAFGLGERVLRMNNAPFDAEKFVSAIADFVAKLSLSPIRKKEPETMDFTKSKRGVLLDLMETLHMKTRVSPTLVEENESYPFAVISVDASKCTLCNACVTLCPTKALRKADNNITFVYSDCIACSLCEQACPEEAIDVKRVLDFSRMLEKTGKELVHVEHIACSGCGELFMPKSAFERIAAVLKEGGGEGELTMEERLEMLKYCKKCRPVKAIELSLDKVEREGK